VLDEANESFASAASKSTKSAATSSPPFASKNLMNSDAVELVVNVTSVALAVGVLTLSAVDVQTVQLKTNNLGCGLLIMIVIGNSNVSTLKTIVYVPATVVLVIVNGALLNPN
jgi:hypothetical protein